MIRVCLADDQALFRSGMRALLALFEGIAVVAEADQGEAAVAKVLEYDRTSCCWTCACRE